MTYREAYTEAERRFKEAGIEEAKSDSRILIYEVCNVRLAGFLLMQDEEMPDEPAEIYFSMVKEREKRIPLQYISGYQYFMDLEFKVDERVLIPREETETLADEALNLLYDMGGSKGRDDFTVLDLGTGSGCLAVTIKYSVPDSKVVASDISAEALELARENAAANKADIIFVQSDLFENIDGQFDLIVSNPPYIPSKAIDGLMPEVRDHEPRTALDGGEDGLAFYRRIAEGCGSRLVSGGYLMMEIGDDQGEAVKKIMRDGGFTGIKLIQDLSGRDRVVSGRRR